MLTETQLTNMIHVLTEAGFDQVDAAAVAAGVQVELAKSEQLAKAERYGLSVDEYRGLQAGRDLIRKSNGQTKTKTKLTKGLHDHEALTYAEGREVMRKFQGRAQ